MATQFLRTLAVLACLAAAPARSRIACATSIPDEP
ncbi:helix-hairpin-helix domain-containing protein, partial [Methylobacterium sp. WL93]